ncbi:Phox-like protein [Coniochaeta ligniaria NRRL 30616]|uniref:Phox-like protein n=1 Tax=Coniochaeta ligniaria NRRL 30616 TaxID=1408157 RepID=A0A1J7JUH9_9PEZI|nr:Phox-like protein [Coniochaeta ligniaria NRRL 30616]
MAPPAEISIPTTSLTSSSDGKPYTLYNITLRLPLRSFVVQKRYSDFAALHSALTSQVGSPPPAPLPGKSWFKSTVSSPELTENRRKGLETYLRAIAETPDRRWRDTSAWRAFLNLPSTAAGSAASASGVSSGTRVVAAAAANGMVAATDPGTWLDLHREMKGALHEARMALARRDAAGEGSGTRVEAGGQAKRALVKAGSLIVGLSDGLRVLRENGRLGDGELRRRRDLVAAARAERDGLEKLSVTLASSATSGSGPAGHGDKAAATGRVLGAPLPETESTRELDNDGVLLLQRRMMEEQDQDVNALAQIVRRQKEMGLAIKDEVDRQIEYMDRMDQDVDRLGAKVGVAKERTKRLGG